MPALINLAIANAQAANYSVAKKHLSRANFLSPDNETVILNLAILDEQQKMYDSALENYSKLTVLGHSEGLSGMARIYERLGSYEKAIDAYRKIIKSDFFDKKTKINAQKRIMHLTTRRRARQKEIVEKADSDNN